MPLLIAAGDPMRLEAEAIVLQESSGYGAGRFRLVRASVEPGLPFRFVIRINAPFQTAEPAARVWLFRNCFEPALKVAAECGLSRMAVSLSLDGMRAGSIRVPLRDALPVVREALENPAFETMTVLRALPEPEKKEHGSRYDAEVAEFLRARMEEDMPRPCQAEAARPPLEERCAPMPDMSCRRAVRLQQEAPLRTEARLELPELEERLRRMDVGFSQYLLQLIDAKGMTDAECYKRANVDRKHFSKIRSNPAYRPGKATVLAFCVALELTLPQAQELLSRAGYALSPASKMDVVVEFFISRGIYDVDEINHVLFLYDLPLLGA